MKTLVIDYETTGLNPHKGAQIFSFVITDVESGNSKIIKGTAGLNDLWKNPSITKVCHNLKFELSFTHKLGLQTCGELHDTMIMHQLLDNLDRHALDHIANELGSRKDIKRWKALDDDVAKAAKIYKTYDKIPKSILRPYQVADGERTALIFQAMLPIIQQNKNLLLDYQNEIELIKATVKMESNGIMLARNEANILMQWMNGELSDTEKKTLELTGELINLSSSKQLIHLLYEKYKLPILEYSASGQPATGKDVIEKLRTVNEHPILDLILRKRAYTKGIAMVTSYIDAAIDGIIYPNINTNRAQTGRESSENPNMQNISKDAALKTRFPIPARSCFRARPKHVLFLIDYQGIEMRLGIQGTGSSRLIKLAEQNFDFHDACAKSFFKNKYINETDKSKKKVMRNCAKNARFAMFYGAGVATVATTLQLPEDEVRIGLEQDKRDWPEFYEFMDRCTAFARKNGYIETFFGRKLKVFHDKPYIATDYCIQGSAAGVMKRAQVNVHQYLYQWLPEVKMLLPVHDELILEFPRTLFPQRKGILSDIRQLMIDIPEITVPLEVEIEMTTTTWNKSKKVTWEEL